MALRYDVAIVGGGPAGATAARCLAAGGARTLLLERQRVPRYKTCGGGLIGRALASLPAGLALPVEREFREVEMRLWGTTRRFVVRRDAPIVSMTMRADLDAALLSVAAARGADVRDATELTALELGDGGITLGAGRERVAADLLVAADGATGRTSSLAGWPARPAGIPALECELRGDRDAFRRFGGEARFDFGLPTDGYAWVFPKREHLSIGVLRMARGGARLHRVLEQYLAALGLSPGAEAETHGYVIPLEPRREGCARGRTLLVGDAAGLADPVTGEGISWAMRSGELAAQACLSAGGDPGRAGSAYTAALDASLLPELRAARRLAGLLYTRPALRGALFALHGQALCEAVAEVVRGARDYRSWLDRPASWLRLLVPGFAMRASRRTT